MYVRLACVVHLGAVVGDGSDSGSGTVTLTLWLSVSKSF